MSKARRHVVRVRVDDGAIDDDVQGNVREGELFARNAARAAFGLGREASEPASPAFGLLGARQQFTKVGEGGPLAADGVGERHESIGTGRSAPVWPIASGQSWKSW